METRSAAGRKGSSKVRIALTFELVTGNPLQPKYLPEADRSDLGSGLPEPLVVRWAFGHLWPNDYFRSPNLDGFVKHVIVVVSIAIAGGFSFGMFSEAGKDAWTGAKTLIGRLLAAERKKNERIQGEAYILVPHESGQVALTMWVVHAEDPELSSSELGERCGNFWRLFSDHRTLIDRAIATLVDAAWPRPNLQGRFGAFLPPGRCNSYCSSLDQSPST